MASDDGNLITLSVVNALADLLLVVLVTGGVKVVGVKVSGVTLFSTVIVLVIFAALFILLEHPLRARDRSPEERRPQDG